MPSEPTVLAPRWLDVREQAVWRAYLEMTGQLTARLGRDIQEQAGLSLADFSVLVNLSEHEGDRMRVLELARSLRWEKSRLSHQLTRMQQRGLIDRSNCSEDRRGAFVVLTDAGRAAVEAAAPRHVESVRSYLFDELTADQIDQLGEIARVVVARLGAGAESGCAGQSCGESDGALADGSEDCG